MGHIALFPSLILMSKYWQKHSHAVWKKVMPDVISLDQTGFMTGQHSFSNVRCLLNVLYSPASTAVAEMVISLDAEKAFDRVEWSFLFE